MQDKRKLFEQHLREQDKIRGQLQEQKKLAEMNKNNPQQDMLYIQKQFRSLFQDLQSLISDFKQGKTQSITLINHHSKIKQYYLNMNYVLTTYDRQFYKQLLDKHYSSIIQIKKKKQPKRKFKFSRRDEDFGVKKQQQVKTQKLQNRKQTQIPGIQNKKNQYIIITQQCQKGGSFKIVQCQGVNVQILQKTQILFLKNLKNCIIKAGVTRSTVFVDKCQNCKFQLNCHQLRIHNTYESTFGIFVTSKAIIQDCNKVVFKPYSFDYPQKKTHQAQQQKSDKPNLWQQIQDFNWLKDNQKSPHFTLLHQ